MSARRSHSRAQRRGECDLDLCQDWIAHVRNASAKSTVLVQHKKDAEILRSLGVKHVYYYQEPEHQLLQAIADIRRPCIVLWDATRPGNAKCQRITDTLQKLGVEVNTRFRKFLFTTPFKALSGLLSFIHAHVYDSPRKHEGVRF